MVKSEAAKGMLLAPEPRTNVRMESATQLYTPGVSWQLRTSSRCWSALLAISP